MIEDVRLRDVTEEDIPTFFQHQVDLEANRMAGFAPRDHEAFTAHWTRVLGDDTVFKRTVLVDGRVAGNLVSFDRSGRREVGYWIGREFWGRGVATAALSAFLDVVESRPLHAHVATHNVGSIRVLEKCGFTVSTGEGEASREPGDQVEEVLLELP